MASHATSAEPVPGVRQVILPSPLSHRLNLPLYYWGAAARALAAQHFDVVHVHHGMGGYVIPLLRTRFPVVLTCRGYTPGIAKDARLGGFGIGAAALGEKIGVHAASEVVTVARTHLDYYEQLRGAAVHWIPNGVEAGTVPCEPSVANTPYLAFAAARIIPIKGLHVLLEAAKRLHLRLPIHVIGDLSADPAYAQQVTELARGLDVRFVGLIREKAQLLRIVAGARLFVFPSFTEAMSNMLLEAISCGVPMVCSGIPENRAVLEDGETVFFETGSAADLARAIEWSLAHESEARARALVAQRRVVAEYNWDRIAEQYAAMYESLSRRPRNAGLAGAAR